jgi:tetratricopeptide (TPR) repeat protein
VTASSGTVAAAEQAGPQPPAQQPEPASGPVSAAPLSSASVKPAGVRAINGRRPWKILVPAAVALVATLIAAGTYFRSRQATALTEKDFILLADFVNTTGEGVFDGTLKQALAVQLEQSPYINVLPESRIHTALRLMGRSADERVTGDVAREICLRQGIKAILTGSISSLGSHYVISLAVVNGQTGDALAREQVEAESKEQVLKSLDRAASSLRQKLGESLSSIQRFATPLEQATTSSLEALKEFTLGQAAHMKFAEEEAIPHLQRAIELDPNFAMAYATQGVAYGNLAQPRQAADTLKKAFELRERASERERLYISAHYYDESTGQIEKAIEIYEQWKQTYPRDTTPRDNLAFSYQRIGQHDKAVANASEAMRLDPKDPYAYQNLAFAYMGLNRYDDAKAVVEQAISQKLTARAADFARYQLAFIRGDATGMKHEIESSVGTSDEPFLFRFKARGECSLGRMQAARKSFVQAANAAQRYGRKEFVAIIRAQEASCEAELHNFSTARQVASEALTISEDRDARAISATVLARTGDAKRAEKLLGELEKEFPTHTLLNKVRRPVARAIIELQRNNPTQAITVLDAAKPYELGGGPDGAHYWPMHIRGEAYLRAGDGAKAESEYRKILDHRGVSPLSPLYGLARLGLGRAYQLQGNAAKARTAYQDFFALWKNADPDIPILRQAKAEYAKLK